MACNVAQVKAAACASGLACLSERDLLIVIAQTLASGQTATQLLAAACASGIACLDDRLLQVVITQKVATAVTPLSFLNMVGWLRADLTLIVPTPADGTSIGLPATIWQDVSANNRDASQGGANPIPTFETNEVNGKPVVRFGTLGALLVFPELTFTGDFTVILIGRVTDGVDTLCLNHTIVNHQLRKNQSGHDAATFAGVGFHSSTAFAGLSSTFQMTTWRRSGTTFSWRQNKTARGTASEALQTLRLNALMNNTFLGTGFGDIGELVSYAAHRTDAQLDSLYDSWFKPRWALP